MLRCDRCGSDSGVLYTVVYDRIGSMEFILCEKHNGPLEKLKDLNYGTWKPQKPARKRGIQKVDLADVVKKKP